jgi:Putative Flp pilus-assembly TadE/G-like/von Willebrand factor type A domain
MSTIQLKRDVSASAPNRESQKALGAVGRVRSRIADFSQDAAGDVAMMFGLMTFVMFGMIGAAVDLGRWLNARDQTVAAVDSAVLAAASSLRTNGNEAQALAVAQRYYNEAIKNRLKSKTDNISFKMAENGTAITGQGSATISTPFMGILGVKELPLLKVTGGEFGIAKLAVGGNAETNIEISMMLDVSGSMGEGSKLADMKAAAKDLVDIIVWADQSEYTSKIALVPFSGDVRPPSTWVAPLQAIFSVTDPLWPATRTKVKWGNNYVYTKTPCVAERAGANKHTDVFAGLGSYVMAAYSSNGNCSTPSASVVRPLSNDKTAIKNNITNLSLGGGTAGHIGTAWTYYMISPNWGSLLTGLSLPVAYGTSDTKKFAILMTDGEYNYTYDNEGVPTSATGAGNSANGNSSSAQALATCNQMKQDGIEVYTVGFDLGGNVNAINTLKNCASDNSKAYTAETGEQLKQSFRDIALKISSIYLSK